MTHIRQRIDTASGWAAENPILQEGERGHETNTRKSKMGDGVTRWNDLEYEVSGFDATADDVGLGEVDNTSDEDKPVSTATQAALDALDAAKADAATTAPLASPSFTGNPTAPTPTAGDNDTSLATTAFVAIAVAAAVAGASFTAGLAADLPAHREGLAYYETDLDQIVVSDGTNWNVVWRKLDLTTHHIRLRRTASQALTTDGSANISWDTIVESSGLFVSTPPALPLTSLSIPRTGLWEIIVTGSHSSSSSMLHIGVTAGGVSKTPIRLPPNTVQPTVATATIKKKLTLGDTVLVSQFLQGSGNTAVPPYAPELTLTYLGAAV